MISQARRGLARAASLALFLLGLGGLAVSCGGDGGGGGGRGGSGGSAPQDPCEGEACGVTCTGDEACAAGTYCGPEGTCKADCGVGVASCLSGMTCSERGRCVPEEDPGGFGGGLLVPSGASGAGGEPVCNQVDVSFTNQTPTVVLLIDQSGSMTQRFGTQNRWQALYESLMDPTTGIVKMLEGEVRFGLALYTSINGNRSGNVCPMLETVDIALNNYDAIDAVYGPAQPPTNGETPTGESLSAVAAELAAFAEEGPKVIVLATDGEPDTCDRPNPQQGQPQAIAAAQAAYAEGIRTFIIGVGEAGGDGVTDAHLQDMANAGAGLPIGGTENAPFYRTLDPEALLEAFDDIINGVRSCTITMDGSVTEQNAPRGTVTLDGQELLFGDPNGWRFQPPDQIEVLGTACETVQDGEHDLKITFPCEVFVPR